MFDKRLDFLMNITHTSNAVLAKAVNIDPSAVSRLRTGRRGLPKYPDFLPDMASFFSKNLIEDYQKKTVAEEICPDSIWDDNPDYNAKMIYNWLLSGQKTSAFGPFSDGSCDAPFPQKAGYFYGSRGLCNATISLLKAVISDGSPRKILLIYEGDADLFETLPGFDEEWLPLFRKVKGLGCDISLIRLCKHSPELVLEKAMKWLPPCSGIFMPHLLCPKLAELMSFRMLIVASGLLAVQTSLFSKVPDSHDLVQLIADKSAVKALEHEFYSYEEHCSPVSELISAPLPSISDQCDEGCPQFLASH
ncbi:MAG: hypothetical protein GX025_04035 [Clostridiales bacterium]|nr:hypothetical protein [Clostridiales bacterium]